MVNGESRNGARLTMKHHDGWSRSCASIALHASRGVGRGFTLIEMLVVLMIMGLLVGLVSAITRPDDRAVLRVEAERLAQLLDLAAVRIAPHGQIDRLDSRTKPATASGVECDDAGWSEIRDSDLLRARTLPQGMRGLGPARRKHARRRSAMRLEFAPYGPALAFTIEMSLGAERYAVAGSPVGDVRALPGDRKTQWRRGAVARRTGFTLVEVLVALAIVSIALLAALRAAGQGTTQCGRAARAAARRLGRRESAGRASRPRRLAAAGHTARHRARRAASSSPGARRSSPRRTPRFAASMSSCSRRPKSRARWRTSPEFVVQSPGGAK